MIGLRFFYFESTSANLLVYFSVATIILYYGPQNIMPSLNQARHELPIIETPYGNIRGMLKTSTRLKRDYVAYLGIPYAIPPVGDLRFRKPEPLPDSQWEGIFEATKNPQRCYQREEFFLSMGIGSEDCLYLNIYAPLHPQSEKLLPVMVWIHGGAMMTGSASGLLYNPSHFMDKDVIIVAIQYRLGPLGSLNLGLEEANGNQALWDQQESLKWIQRNIERFGGNPKKVTLFGESAGGKSVSYHLVAESSKGLFQAAIIQSGPITTTLNISRHNNVREVHERYAERLGCPVEKAVSCLRSKKLDELFSDALYPLDECNTMVKSFPNPNPWTPTVDHEMFHRHPSEIFSGPIPSQVPIIIGFTSDEGLLESTSLLKKGPKYHHFKSNWKKCIINNAFSKPFFKITPFDEELADEIARFYGEEMDEETFDIPKHFKNITNMFSDFYFSGPTDFTVRKLVQNHKKPVYYYMFSHRGHVSISDFFSNGILETVSIILRNLLWLDSSKHLGCSHTDDLIYLWKLPFLNYYGNQADEEMSQLMIDLWTNFATTFNPNGQKLVWKPATIDKVNYVQLSQGKIDSQTDSNQDKRFKFWYYIKDKYEESTEIY